MDPIIAPGSEMFPSFDETSACSPPQEIDGGLLFMSRQEEVEKVRDYSEYTNVDTDFMADESLYPEVAEEAGDAYFQDLYPNGTLIR